MLSGGSGGKIIKKSCFGQFIQNTAVFYITPVRTGTGALVN